MYGGQKLTGHFIRSSLILRTARVSATGSMSQVAPNFRAQLGNFDRAAVERYDGSVHLDFRPRGPLTLQGLGGGLSGSITNRYRGGMLDYSVYPSLSMRFGGKGSFTMSESFNRSTFLGEPLDTRNTSAYLTFPAGKLADITLGADRGDAPIYDFVNPRIGTSQGWRASAYLYLMPSLIITPMYSHTTVKEPGGGPAVVEANLLYMTAEYQHTPSLGFRAMTNISDQSSVLLENPFSRESAYAQSSFIITYELAPTSFAYLGLNDERQRFVQPVVEKTGFMRTGLRVFFKLSYLMRM
jgi:hypothetical protein